MTVRILGISCYCHDAAASLVVNGEVVAATEEERFTRNKHDNSFPENAAQYCLKEAEISAQELDYVSFYEKPLVKLERILQTFVETFPWSYRFFYRSIPEWINKKIRIRSQIRDKLGFEGDILFADHHLSHASGAFFPSPFDQAAIITVDGAGEWTTTGLYEGKGNEITPLKTIDFPHSLGLLYSTITSFLGFMVNNDEYKVMGLAAYGQPEYESFFKDELIDIKQDGSFKLNLDYFSYRSRSQMWSDKLEEVLGEPREREAELTQRDKNLAATLQKITEDIMLKTTNHIYELTSQDNLCMAGGVALNSLCNGKIRRETPFDKVWIQPAATDAGSALGSALYTYNQLLDNKSDCEMDQVFLGPEYSNKEIEQVLQEEEADYDRLDRKELLTTTAKLLAQGQVVGWFQGRLEWGPRALGNRCILADPRREEMKDIVNNKVKHREEFRPFAPSVLEGKADEYFDCDYQSPFMLFVFNVHEDKRDVIPAVTHVDGTSRIQTVSRDQNRLYYDLIDQFEKETRVPVLLNTSFNVRGEPIVRTPAQAWKDFQRTGIDVLVAGNFIVGK